MKQNKHAKQALSPAAKILLGGGICILSFLGVMLLFSMLILTTKNPLKNSDAFSPLAFAVAGIFAGWIGRKALGDGRIFLCCPPLLLLISLLLGLLLSGGKISLSAILSELIFLGASYLAFYLARKKSTRKKRRH